MKPRVAVKPISLFKAHAAEILRDVSEGRGTVILTQKGEAKAVLQNVRDFGISRFRGYQRFRGSTLVRPFDMRQISTSAPYARHPG